MLTFPSYPRKTLNIVRTALGGQIGDWRDGLDIYANVGW